MNSEKADLTWSFRSRGTTSYPLDYFERAIDISTINLSMAKRRLNTKMSRDQGNIHHVQKECFQGCVLSTMVLFVSPGQPSWKRSKRLCTTN